MTKKLEDTITRFDDRAEQQEENQKKIEAELTEEGADYDEERLLKLQA